MKGWIEMNLLIQIDSANGERLRRIVEDQQLEPAVLKAVKTLLESGVSKVVLNFDDDVYTYVVAPFIMTDENKWDYNIDLQEWMKGNKNA